MKYRTVELLASGDQADGAGTKEIPIRVKDVISRINIYWQVTMGDDNMDAEQYKDISKIELVDGSEVLFSLDGGQAQALCIYDRKIPTMNYKQKLNANSLASNYGIDFGRFLHDPLLALDPKKFDNLMLKITYNEDICNTSSSANELGVKAEVFDEKVVSPVGYLSAKEIYSKVPPAAGYSYIQLPTNETIRKLIVQGYLSAYEPWYTVSEARLNEDNDKRVIFDWNMERYYRMMQAEWAKVIDEFLVYSAGSGGGNSFFFTPTDYYVVVNTTDFSSYLTGGAGTIVRGGKMSPVAAAAQSMMGEARGYLPNHCFEFPFGNPQDIDDWYDLANVGDLELRLKVGTYDASAEQSVVLQTLRRY